MSVQSYFQLLNPIVFSMFSIAFLCVSAASSRGRAAALFGVSYAIGATAFTVDFFRNALPTILAAFASNALYTATTVVFTIGMCVRYRSAAPVRWLVSAATFGYICYLALYFFAPGMWTRSFGINFVNGVLLLMGVFTIARSVKNPLDLGIFCLFVVMAVQCFVRPLMVYFLDGGEVPAESYTNSTFFYTFHLAVGVLAIALAMNLLIALVGELISDLGRRYAVDSLTGLLNRIGFDTDAAASLGSTEEAAALIVGEVDRFKHLNDTNGFEFGDRLIAGFGEVIRAFSHGDRIGARLNAARFALLAPGVRMEDARLIAETVRRNFANAAIDSPVGKSKFTASFGVAERCRGEPLGDLLARAERALTLSKMQGGDQTMTQADISEVATAMEGQSPRKPFQRQTDFQYKAV